MSLRGLKFNFTRWNSGKCSWCISIVMWDQFWDLRWSVSCQPCDISESLTVSWFVKQASLNAGVEDSVWGFMIARFNSEWRVNHSKAGQQKATNPMFLYADRVMQDAQSLRLRRWPIHTSTRPMWYGLVEALTILVLLTSVLLFFTLNISCVIHFTYLSVLNLVHLISHLCMNIHNFWLYFWSSQFLVKWWKEKCHKGIKVKVITDSK
jgi:hypothetical protein